MTRFSAEVLFQFMVCVLCFSQIMKCPIACSKPSSNIYWAFMRTVGFHVENTLFYFFIGVITAYAVIVESTVARPLYLLRCLVPG